MKITVFGAGYVGLVAAACLADVGHELMCVDTDEAKVAALQKGQLTIHEPGLAPIVRRNLNEGRLTFTTDADKGVKFGELLFIAVGTPPDEDGSADLTYVLAVAQSIGQHMETHKVVVNKSTVPVGTSDRVRSKIANALSMRGVDIPFDVCSNPEFLKEGSAVEDFTKGARIVVGTDSEQVREMMRECYAPYNRRRDKMIFMSTRSAELTKYAANVILATKISFINEIANLAERLGADIEQVREGIGSDPRIGYDFIYPGCGYGGSCFPKDVKALIKAGVDVRYDAEILRAVDMVNSRQKEVLFQKLRYALHGALRDKTIAVWGLAFKPNTDDMREAPSRSLIEALWEEGARIRAYDPAAMNEAKRIYGNREDLQLVEHRDEAVADAEALVICTEWKMFRAVNLNWLKQQLRQPVVVDGRNLFDPMDMKQAGFAYYAIGRGESMFLA